MKQEWAPTWQAGQQVKQTRSKDVPILIANVFAATNKTNIHKMFKEYLKR